NTGPWQGRRKASPMLLYRPGSDPTRPVRLLRGRFLAHNKWTKPRRAFLGVDILAGKAQPVDLTRKHVARLVGVSVSYLEAAQRVAFSRPDLRSACESGLQPLLGAVARPGRAERLATMWAKASADERRAFIAMAGIDAVFNATVEAA